jgi:NAD(P)-dependent dehydrogenase (short-subunit alcohol dehydrogenase family)
MPQEGKKQQALPSQHQDQRPGVQSEMTPQPVSESAHDKPAGKLRGKAAIVTGGDSGIGRAVAIAFAKEGADVCVAYLCEHEDAKETKKQVEAQGRRCLLVAGDLGDEGHCLSVVEHAVREFGKLDILINNAGEQHPQKSIEDISAEQLERTFRTNVFAYFFMTKAAVRHFKEGAAIVNTASVTAYAGSPELLDYSSSKGAEVAFTRSLSINLAERKIRVNAVAPGPIWTPLIPSTFPEEKVKTFGSDTPMKRPGQPEEVANGYVFLASDDASYISGQTLHINGGEVVNG